MKKLIENYFDRLWPINRSLTGEGNRETLRILSELVDIKVNSVPSGTPCLDWTVPPEWNLREAWIKDSTGNTIIDFKNNNLHVMGYSTPVSGKLKGRELLEHIYALPEQPDWIPYVTSYYQPKWGFCMPYKQKLQINPDADYEVLIDSTLDEMGEMVVGEALIKGEQTAEILFSTYICHPSMANNELSGPLVAAMLYHELAKWGSTKYTYRFAFVPETIGSIYMLYQHGEHWKKNLLAGYVLTCIGDSGSFTYKRSRLGNSLADRVAEVILRHSGKPHQLINFFPLGSDERQYCSPGFNLPVGSLMRTMYGQYAQYHTSADNKDFISFAAMEEAVLLLLDMIKAIEHNRTYINTLPYGEPQLGKRGLYPTADISKNKEGFVKTMMWLLNYADGAHDLLDISTKSNIAINEFYPVVKALMEKGVIISSDAP
jgi:aminopeptidase-like protein